MTPDRTDTASTRLRHRLRLLAGCLLLGAIAFNTSPGQVISETKVDMALNPLGFLSRAAHLWDGAFFGHLQNQAHGYFFPMGPFYALFEALDMPPWSVQRLWMTAVLCAAFVGVERLARAMGIGTPATRLLAGLAYALAPHAIALIGINSSEFQPSAVLPWILLPLVRGTRGDAGPRRAAALSALAFVFAGGINAVAELAVLVVPLLYLLTRRKGPRRRRLLAWWLGCVGAVSMWWLAPLLVMGQYIFSFLPFIETASATTQVTSLLNILRGTSTWISFLAVDGRAWLPAAFEQAADPRLIAATALAAGLGAAGIAARATPERAFLAVSALAGIAIVSFGHADALAHPWTEQVRALLDGPLAPFRNLHKFDALVRLPLALGLAALPLAAPVRLRRPVLAAASGAVLLTATPVAFAGVTPTGGFTELPGYWREAAAWLNEHTGDGMVLAAPGSRRGEYTWGRPMDEPMQSLLTVRWAAHSNVPWGSPGLARLLQAVDERFAAGRGSPGLTSALRRIGVTYLLVRNDLARETLGTAWPARVHETLDESTGLRRVAAFGPEVGSASSPAASGWFDQPYPALEIYAVPDPAPQAATVPREGTLRVTGAPEAVLALAEEGLLTDDRATLLGDEPEADVVSPRNTVVTDTLRRRELVFGDVRRSASNTLTEDQRLERGAPSDLTDPAWERATATADYSGILDVVASSAESSVTAPADRRDPGRQPYAALDGDLRTSWRSDGWSGAVGQWLEVRFVESIEVPRITVAFEQSAGPPVSEVSLETAAGTRRVAVSETIAPQSVAPPAGKSSWLRIRVTKLAGGARTAFGNRVGIAEVTVPGVKAARRIVVPAQGESDPGAVLLTRQGTAPACVHGSRTWTCSPYLEIQGEDGFGFDREFTVRTGGARLITGRATLTDPVSARRLTTLPRVFPKIAASSTATDHPAVIGRSAMDGDLGTLWYANTADPNPTLTVELGRRTTVSRLQVIFPDSYLGQPPVRVTVRGGGRTVRGWIGPDDRIAFTPLRTDRLEITFTASASRPIEVAEIGIPGVEPLASLDSYPLRLPCGYGPSLVVNGNTVPTEIVDGTLGDVVGGRPLGYRSCEPVELAAGAARVGAGFLDAFRIESMLLRPPADPAAGARALPARAETWGPAERRVRIATSEPSYLVVNENHNRGWKAYLNGRELIPARLDGWRQAWEVPAVTGLVTLRYEPDSMYRAALLGGLALVLLVAAAACVPARRTARRPAGTAPAAIRAAWVWPLAPVAGLWTGGFAGAAIVCGALALYAWLEAVAQARHARGGLLPGLAGAVTAPWSFAVPLGLAGLVPLAGRTLGLPAGSASAEIVVQVLCLVAVAGLLAAVPGRGSTPAEPETPVLERRREMAAVAP
ncbi:alpha-(1-_3)-arabinofuranosyltransferase [Planomonospora venezuelensis]|uniref:Arabinofuranan 3-O-arabinosyltransferase n=1 Tax=Planomonospora venezuelensis TaxID=1999 RepID=A0A841D141_PLAVE|nr:alpha-(1->3)-arabinofuranosyltransferase [Planomonospora venezuelensis]MBB5962027.1 arabinofuranan 3-O-arabinosyltransferase [Planomonospora venezuelensis]